MSQEVAPPTLNNLTELQPGPEDLVVVPYGTKVPEGVPFKVHQMKFLHQPSIVRIGYTMEFLKSFNLSSLSQFFGLGDKQSIRDVVFEDGGGRKLRDSEMPNTVIVEGEVMLKPAIMAEVKEDGSLEVIVPNPVEVSFPSDVAKTDLPKFFRYKRPVQLIKKVDGNFTRGVAPKGGVTFYIELDAANKTFAFSYALCHNKDNFNYETGRLISKGRFESEDWYEVRNYDESIGVVENIAIAVANLLYHGDVPEHDRTNWIDFSVLSPKFNELDMKELFERI